MRLALSGLTTRGRCFIAAGVATVISALLLGEKDLLRVAIFLIVIPVIAALIISRTQFQLSCTRSISPARTPSGEPAQVRLTLDNVSRLPTGVLLVEDTLPYTLGGRPRFVIDRISAGGAITVDYEVRADVRGRYRIGPLQLRLSDPFGLVELTRGFSSLDVLTVVPAVYPLPNVGLGGAWSTGGDNSARSVAIQGEDDAATRDYRHGDDLRKVHWRSTARTGKMMVRREEQPWQTRSALLLDQRLARHRGEGAGASFEWAVTAAASIGVHLGRVGYSLRLFSDDGEQFTGTDGDFSSSHLLLDHLAITTTSSNHGFDRGIAALRQSGEDGLLVAIVGDLSPDEAQAMTTGRGGNSTSIAVVLDVSRWMSSELSSHNALRARHEAAVAVLRHSGWRVVVGQREATISEAWRQAAVSSFAAGTATFGGSSVLGVQAAR